MTKPDSNNPFLRALAHLGDGGDGDSECPSGATLEGGTSADNQAANTTAGGPVSQTSSGDAVGMQPVGDILEGLLAPFGLTTSGTRNSIEAQTAAFCAGVGIDAGVRSLRYGILTLECDPNVAEFLEYDTDQLISELQTSWPDQVNEIRVRCRARS